MDILFKKRGLRIGWKGLSVYRLDSQGNTIPYDGGDTPRGVNYTRILDAADQNRIVAACTNWIAKQVTQPPVVLETLDADGNTERVDSHDILDVLRKPNAYQSGRELRAVSVWDILTAGQGSAYWFKVRSGRGRVIGLEYLPARRVEVKGTPQQLITEYNYSPDGVPPVSYTPEDIVHLRLAPDPRDPKLGLPLLRAVAQEIWIDEESSNYSAALLRNRGVPGVIGSPPEQAGVLAKEVADEAEAHLNSKLTGSGRGRTTILRAAMRLDQLGFNPAEMDLSALRNTSEESICADLGISPLAVTLGAGAQESHVGTATVEIMRDAWVNTIIPFLEAIAEQTSRQLLPDFEPESGRFTLRFDLNGVMALQPDLQKEWARVSQGVTAGWTTVMDARDATGLETDENDDYYLRGLNVLPYPAGEPVLPPEPPQEPEPVEDAEEQEARYQAELERVKAIALGTWTGMREKAEVWR